MSETAERERETAERERETAERERERERWGRQSYERLPHSSFLCLCVRACVMGACACLCVHALHVPVSVVLLLSQLHSLLQSLVFHCERGRLWCLTKGYVALTFLPGSGSGKRKEDNCFPSITLETDVKS